MTLTDLFFRSRRTFAAPQPRPSLVGLVDLWRSRQALKRLDADALRDVGLDREQAETEAAKPVWDVPAHWLS